MTRRCPEPVEGKGRIHTDKSGLLSVVRRPFSLMVVAHLGDGLLIGFAAGYQTANPTSRDKPWASSWRRLACPVRACR